MDGLDVSKVWEAAASAIERARSGRGPAFLHARCVHFEGHFLGFQLIRLVRDPLKEMPKIAIPLTRSFLRPGGAGWRERLAGMKTVLKLTQATRRDPRRDQDNDPIRRARVEPCGRISRVCKIWKAGLRKKFMAPWLPPCKGCRHENDVFHPGH